MSTTLLYFLTSEQLLILAMAVTGGWSQDVVTRVVNVQWGGGLAVEFYEKDT